MKRADISAVILRSWTRSVKNPQHQVKNLYNCTVWAYVFMLQRQHPAMSLDFNMANVDAAAVARRMLCCCVRREYEAAV